MKSIKACLTSAMVTAASLLCVSPSPCQERAAQLTPLDPSIKRTLVPLAVPMAVYEPIALGAKSHIGVFVQHPNANSIRHSACTELAKRGYTVLCSAAADAELLDGRLMQAKSGVAYLRQYPGIRKVILWGHSGGATLLTAYQLVAENGPRACQGPEKLIKCADTLAGLPAADGVVLGDSNWGSAAMNLFSVNPAVVSNDSGVTVNPDLDLWNPKNGFNPAGAKYSSEFIRRFQIAVAKREMRASIKAASARLAAIEAGEGRFIDDEPFFAAGAGGGRGNNKLFTQDTRLMSRTQKEWPLLHGDGSITTEIVHTVRVPENMKPSTDSLRGAFNGTVRGFLMNSAVRVTADFGYDESTVRGIDWTSSCNASAGNVRGIKVPLLLMGMTAGWEFLAHETIYEKASSPDKTLVFVEGATHGYRTCKPCERTPGQFGDTIKTIYDYADKWLSQEGRF